MRVKQSSKKRQVARLKESNGCNKEACGQKEGKGKAAHIDKRFFREATVSPETTDDDQEIANPSGDGNDLVNVLKLPCSDRGAKPVKPAEKECCNEEIEVVPEASGGKTDEIAPATSTNGKNDGGKIHPGLKEMKPSN